MDVEPEAEKNPSRRTDRSKRKCHTIWQCVNPDCSVSKPSLLRRTASSLVLSFFGLKKESKTKRKVCESCFEVSQERCSLMMNRIRDGKPCLTEDLRLPVPKDMVMLDDSDEEMKTDSSEDEDDQQLEIDLSEFALNDNNDDECGDDEKKDIEEKETSKFKKLESLVENVFESLGFKYQIQANTEILKARLDNHGKDFEKTDLLLKDLESQVNTLRNELYADFKPKLKRLPSIDLDDLDGVNNQNHLQTQINRKTNKHKSRLSKDMDILAINSSSSSSSIIANLPPIGELERPLLQLGDRAFAMRGNILNIWKEGTVVEIDRNNSGEIIYKLRFEVSGKVKSTSSSSSLTSSSSSSLSTTSSSSSISQTKVLSRRHVSYIEPSKVRLPVGTRVIGVYKDDSFVSKGEFYSGVIAEPPKVMNKFRYLVFFDDGYASYIAHKDIRVVTLQSQPEVWEDIHPNSREFIKQYLSQYPERPMVKLSVDQIVWTEWDGKWWATKVVAVDASLVRLVFRDNGRTESVYRGSTRLSPLFKEMQQQKMRKEGLISLRRQNFSSSARKNTPYVEYTRQTDDNAESSSSASSSTASSTVTPTTVKRAVARKSTASSNSSKKNDFDNVPKIRWESKGEIYKVNLPQNAAEPRPFKKHECSLECCLEENRFDENTHMKCLNVLMIPIVLGWQRQLTKHKNSGCRKIYYIAPCGRRLRNMIELHQYLRLTGSTLEIDFFTFEWWVHVYNEFKPTKELCKINDISYGKENVPISCVNSLDNNYPEYIEYSTKRIPQNNVNLNLDESFLICCDCEDDCIDKDKCACWQLTIQATSAGPENRINQGAGYEYRRLPDVVPTGIYECNSKCKCKPTCFNRVAQNPLRVKLQVFKTEKRGWGIRALHDIPQGGFVCVYVGNLYTNEEANKLGQNFGDEYFAELDMIEAIERRKEGYESDCGDSDFEDGGNVEIISDFSGSNDDDDDSRLTEDEEYCGESFDKTVILKGITPDVAAVDRQTRSVRRQKKEVITVCENEVDKTNGGGEPSSERAVMGFGASVSTPPPDPSKPKHISTRKYFDKDEDVYIMDAKTIGNIGRYLNHSCNPNIFVQNCFVDSHDLRYPWISFFASTFIRAGQELCWDYCYIVDQVEGKEIYCECGADNCRGRLL